MIDENPEFASVVVDAEKMHSSLLKDDTTLESLVKSTTVVKIRRHLTTTKNLT